MPEIGTAGQNALRRAKILVVGAGGLGSPAALYLAAAGVGTIGIIDDDTVDISNLQRQVIHTTPAIGRPKVDSARNTLSSLNPDVTVRTYNRRLTQENAQAVIRPYGFVIDATDNFDSKFLIADACHRLRKPYSHAGVFRFIGQTMTVLPGKSCCCRCIFRGMPEDPNRGRPPQGPVGAIPGVIGSVQAMEAMKFLLGTGGLLLDRLIIYDALHSTFRSVAVKRAPGCPLCGSNSRSRTKRTKET